MAQDHIAHIMASYVAPHLDVDSLKALRLTSKKNKETVDFFKHECMADYYKLVQPSQFINDCSNNLELALDLLNKPEV